MAAVRLTRLLLLELVRREADDRETLRLVSLVQRLELLVLGRQAALRSDVDDQDDLALERAKVERARAEGRALELQKQR